MAEGQTPLPAKPNVLAPAVAGADARTSGRLDRARQGLADWLGWHIWALLAIALAGGTGLYALDRLVRLPGLPECESTVWTFAPASKRIYCGQSYAEGGTPDDFLDAIALVDVLEPDHPLRGEADKKVTEWTMAILDLGEAKFQAGDFDVALALAKRIPTHLEASPLVEARMEAWQDLWTKATGIADRVQQLALAAEWQQAEVTAARLANLRNDYWAEERYEVILAGIREAKDEYERLGFAREAVSDKASIEELLGALAKALSIEPKSIFYERAQELAAQASEQLVARGRQTADGDDWSEVMEIARALPTSMGLEEYRRDFLQLGRAGLRAQQGTVEELEAAIATMDDFDRERPLYDEVRRAIARWQVEIRDIGHLTAARNRAGSGRLSDLRAAIGEANKIARGNPRYGEAQQEIWRWAARVQTIEDRPILDRARQQARGGTIAAWQQAIATANRIAPRRALYREAQQYARQWRANIQRTEDTPILNRARTLALNGRLPEAIATARQIAPGRVLYSQAQGLARQWRETIERAEDTPILERARSLALNNRLEEAIATAEQIGNGRVLYPQARDLANRWRLELRAGQEMARAYQIASSSSSPWALAQAIRVASGVPANTSYSDRSRQAIEDWSRRLLAIARQTSATNLEQAIQIANLIPPNSQAHGAARQQVSAWQDLLAPPEPAPEPAVEQQPETPAASPATTDASNG